MNKGALMGKVKYAIFVFCCLPLLTFSSTPDSKEQNKIALLNQTAIATGSATGSSPSTTPTPQNFINWAALCLSDQSLSSKSGCTPDCTSQPTASICNFIFSLAKIEQNTGIQSPVLNNGVVVFELPQTGVKKDSVFNVTLNQTPSNYGYVCEIVNSDATPAFVWDTTTKAYTNLIVMDKHTNSAPYKSNNFVNAVAQGTNGEAGYWHTNPNNPLYMICLSYTTDNNSNYPQSSAACGGSSGKCISYSLE